jgi:hypothetical protein
MRSGGNKSDGGEIWYHCRACGEEGLTPGDARCPNCGISDPVTLCEACQRPIRDGQPWRLSVLSTDAPGPSPVKPYHEACYPKAKREAFRDYPPPNWRIIPDPRDGKEPLSRERLLLGVGLLIAGVGSVFWLVLSSPRPEPLLPAEKWEEIERNTGGPPHWAKSRPGERGPHATFPQVAFAIMALVAGVWGILWGLERRRALFRFGPPNDDLPPDSRPPLS